jgi:NAD-dependent deacetylase
MERAAAILSRGRVVVLAGPGLLACAGLAPPEARGGLWDHFDPVLCATPEALEHTPGRAWEAFGVWLSQVRQVEACTGGPSPEHRALLRLHEHGLLRGVISTTTDGLLRLCGLPRVAELYGAIDRLRCTACAWRGEAGASFQGGPPTCQRCAAPLRPDMVLFGESLPRAPRAQAAQWVYGGGCLLVLGADLTRPPMHRVPEEMLQEGGLTLGLGANVRRGAVERVRGLYLGEDMAALPSLVDAALALR